MKEIPFEELISETDLEELRPQVSEVKRNKNQKTISVSNTLYDNSIKLKVIAPYGKWVEWWEAYMDSPGFGPPFNLEVIQPYFSKRTSAADIGALTKYYQADPWEFPHNFFALYISSAMTELAKKPRGGSPYAASPQQMYQARVLAQHLYVLLGHWLIQPEETWPLELNKLRLTSHERRAAVNDLIERFLGFKLGTTTSPDLKHWEDTFYKAYISKPSLSRIRRYHQKRSYRFFKETGEPCIPYATWDELARAKKAV